MVGFDCESEIALGNMLSEWLLYGKLDLCFKLLVNYCNLDDLFWLSGALFKF